VSDIISSLNHVWVLQGHTAQLDHSYLMGWSVHKALSALEGTVTSLYVGHAQAPSVLLAILLSKASRANQVFIALEALQMPQSALLYQGLTAQLVRLRKMECLVLHHSGALVDLPKTLPVLQQPDFIAQMEKLRQVVCCVL